MRSIIIKTCFVCIAGLFFPALLPEVYSATFNAAQTKEVYTGTVLGVGGPLGGVSRPFTLSIEGVSSNADANRAVAMLAEGGQDALMKELRGKRLGYFSMGSQPRRSDERLSRRPQLYVR